VAGRIEWGIFFFVSVVEPSVHAYAVIALAISSQSNNMSYLQSILGAELNEIYT
jgi:hypothetical protein